MKKFFFLLLLLPAIAATDAVNIDAINKAISSGNADALGQYFDESVELSILDEEDIYDKAVAIAKVKRFFANHQPSGFSKVHEGTSKGNDSRYSIGNLKAGGDTFRVYVYTKEAGGKVLIQELRFDRE